MLNSLDNFMLGLIMNIYPYLIIGALMFLFYVLYTRHGQKKRYESGGDFEDVLEEVKEKSSNKESDAVWLYINTASVAVITVVAKALAFQTWYGALLFALVFYFVIVKNTIFKV